MNSVKDYFIMSFTCEFLRAHSAYYSYLIRLGAAHRVDYWLVLLPEGLADKVLGCKVTVGQTNLLDFR